MSLTRKEVSRSDASPSSRRAWIEICGARGACWSRCVALLAEGVDRNQRMSKTRTDIKKVALLAEGVDRNWKRMHEEARDTARSPSSRRAWIEIKISRSPSLAFGVALLAEGVDRNTQKSAIKRYKSVALLAEGVDRNRVLRWYMVIVVRSPSSRRAWIEIHLFVLLPVLGHVALLAEGVDRNIHSERPCMTRSCRPPRGGRG